MATIILTVSGSIAAYKAADVVSDLTKKNHTVHCLLTPKAEQFVTATTLASLSHQTVHTESSIATHTYPQHIMLADQSDLFVSLATTANTLAEFALGLAQNIVTATYLSINCPAYIAPAMNTRMWQNTVVQQHITTLQNRGNIIIPPQQQGILACGHEGAGKMATVADIITTITASIKSP